MAGRNALLRAHASLDWPAEAMGVPDLNEGSEFVPKPYQVPHFSTPKTTEDYLEEAKEASNPYTLYMDKKSEKSREILIFMEETKIWESVLEDCINRSGVNASGECTKLYEIVDERNKYLNANFNANLRPKNTPGLPNVFERRPQP